MVCSDIIESDKIYTLIITETLQIPKSYIIYVIKNKPDTC